MTQTNIIITTEPRHQINIPKLTVHSKAKIVKKSEVMKLARSIKMPKNIDIDCIRNYIDYSNI